MALWLGRYIKLGTWSSTSDLAAATVTALVLGLLFAYFANCDYCHSLARHLRLTRETSYPSEWFSAFTSKVTFVVLQFKDERRLYGWPKEWPSSPTSGHFVILYPSWLVGYDEQPITGVSSILVNVEDIRWVEFLEDASMEVKRVEEGVKSTAIDEGSGHNH
jgi:hypothetical protein